MQMILKHIFEIDELLEKIDLSKDILFVLDNDRADSLNEWKIHEKLVKNSDFEVVSILSSWEKQVLKQ